MPPLERVSMAEIEDRNPARIPMLDRTRQSACRVSEYSLHISDEAEAGRARLDDSGSAGTWRCCCAGIKTSMWGGAFDLQDAWCTPSLIFPEVPW